MTTQPKPSSGNNTIWTRKFVAAAILVAIIFPLLVAAVGAALDRSLQAGAIADIAFGAFAVEMATCSLIFAMAEFNERERERLGIAHPNGDEREAAITAKAGHFTFNVGFFGLLLLYVAATFIRPEITPGAIILAAGGLQLTYYLSMAYHSRRM